MTKTLTELTAEYYDLISGDHHKDKDCHFYIEKIYSYGIEPYWQFCHYGYCWSIDNFFQDEENIQKYQKHFDKHKDKLAWMKKEELFISLSVDIIKEFPKRETEQEAEQDMRNFLEWAIEKEKKNQLKRGDDGCGF